MSAQNPTLAGHGRLSLVAALSICAGCLTPPERAVDEGVRGVEEKPWDDPDEVIAEVNGRPITRGDFYHRLLEKFGSRTLLSGIIKEELFRQEAERLGITVAEPAVRREVERRIEAEARQYGGMDELERVCRLEGWSLEDMRKDYATRMRAEMLTLEVVRSKRVVDEEALREYYQETYARTRYRLSQVAYRYGRTGERPASELAQRKQEAVEKAFRTMQRARGGEDFAEIARFESEDQLTRSLGGDMGIDVTPEDMYPQVRRAILDLEEGDVSEPVDIEEFGSIHVFKLTRLLRHRSFEECRDLLREELENRLPTVEEIEAVLLQLSRTAGITIFGRPAPTFHDRPLFEGPPSGPSPASPSEGVSGPAPAEAAGPTGEPR